MEANFEAEIYKLILKKQEGQYWDFKGKHQDNKACLLHDILCLANTLHNGDRYLIYGVSDPKEGCQITGVEATDRRSQADIIDFLRSKPFAGDIRPEVELRTIQLQGKEIDVLVIFDKRKKPYYLSEDYRDKEKLIKANSIYTRKVDVNTPINQSADIGLIELMWRERFGLDIQPRQKMIDLLRKPKEWIKDEDRRAYAYHQYNSKYQIKFGELERFEYREVYSYFYPNTDSFIGMAKFKYLDTTLFELPYIYCDEQRIGLALPKNDCIRIINREIWYVYYILDTKVGAFLEFMTQGSLNFQSRGGEAPFIVYFDQNEKDEFEVYVSENIDKFDDLQDFKVSAFLSRHLNVETQPFNPVEMVKLKKFFRNWKDDKEALNFSA